MQGFGYSGRGVGVAIVDSGNDATHQRVPQRQPAQQRAHAVQGPQRQQADQAQQEVKQEDVETHVGGRGLDECGLAGLRDNQAAALLDPGQRRDDGSMSRTV